MMRIPNPGLVPPSLADPRGNFWSDLPGVTDKWGLYQGQPNANMANPQIAIPPPQGGVDPMATMPGGQDAMRAALAAIMAKGM